MTKVNRNTKDLNIKITPSIRDAYETVFQKMYSNRRVLFEDMFKIYLDSKIDELSKNIESAVRKNSELWKDLLAISEQFKIAKECDKLGLSLKMGEISFQISASTEGIETAKERLEIFTNAKSAANI